jgi:hypothetical protein
MTSGRQSEDRQKTSDGKRRVNSDLVFPWSFAPVIPVRHEASNPKIVGFPTRNGASDVCAWSLSSGRALRGPVGHIPE